MGAYNDDVLFIHIPKCGGTAVKHYMADNLPGVKWARPRSWFENIDHPSPAEAAEATVAESGLPIGHIPLRDIPALTGRPLESWDKIVATIRDPYKQTVSQWWFWHHRYAEGDQHPHSAWAAQHPRISTWLMGDQKLVEFHQWYESRIGEDEPLIERQNVKSYTEFGGMYWYWLSVDGALPPNLTIVRQEEMGHQIPLVLAPYMDGPPPEVPVINKSSPINWQLALAASGIEIGNQCLQIINGKFRWCFENGWYQPKEMHAE